MNSLAAQVSLLPASFVEECKQGKYDCARVTLRSHSGSEFEGRVVGITIDRGNVAVDIDSDYGTLSLGRPHADE